MAQASNTVTFSEYLTELFDHPVPFKQTQMLRLGQSYRVFYEFAVESEEYRVEVVVSSDGKQIDVSFDVFDRAKTRWTTKLLKDLDTDVRKVFSTVFEICKIHVKKHPTFDLYFTALTSEPSRVKMYKTMLPRIARSLGRSTSVNSYSDIFLFCIEGSK